MIKVNFKAYGSYLTDSVHQWDLNQTLEVEGLNLTTAPEVHFSNSNVKRAIVRQASLKNGIVTVAIPNSLLQEPFRISAHIGIYEGDTFKVVEVVDIPVTPRTRPEDYQITDTDEELYSFKRLENLLANKATTEQVANIIAHNNDTNGNTELVDLRYGADGKTYASAGEAVRRQFEKIDDAITVRATTDNKFDGVFDESGYIQNDGTNTANEGFKRTSRFYPLLENYGVIYIAVTKQTANFMVMLYDEDKKFLSYVSCGNTLSNVGSIKTTAAYFRVYTNVAFSGQAYVSTIKPGTEVDYNYTAETIVKAEKMFPSLETTIGPLKKMTSDYFTLKSAEENQNVDGNGVQVENSGTYVNTYSVHPIAWGANVHIKAYMTSGTYICAYAENGGVLLKLNTDKPYNELSEIDFQIPRGTVELKTVNSTARTSEFVCEIDPILAQIYSALKALDSVGNTLEGKNITCFGDSLAANCYIGNNRQWVELVGEYFKCAKIYNRGVGGSYVSLVNDDDELRDSYASVDAEGYAFRRVAYARDNAPAGIPVDYVEINACMEGDERVSTIPLDTDILLIEAGINDTGSSSTEKLSAAYDRMLEKIQTRIPASKIIILGIPFTHHQSFPNDEQRNQFREQCEARMEGIRAVAKKYGIPVIEMRDTAQVNLQNWQRYMSADGLHYDTAAGAKRWAEAVIKGMTGLTIL